MRVTTVLNRRDTIRLVHYLIYTFEKKTPMLGIDLASSSDENFLHSTTLLIGQNFEQRSAVVRGIVLPRHLPEFKLINI